MRVGVSLIASSIAAILTSTAALAQSSAAASTTPVADDELGEVVVTARRRAEALQNVPVSVNVVNAATLEKQGVHTDADLQSSIPGLIVRSSNNNNELSYVMRGESVDAYSGSPPGVQPYMDEVPFPIMSSTPFYDLESVQAVKGPQGTLFGRNSTGGAVLFQTATPKNEFDGFVSVQYGNLNRLIANAAFDVPVISDKLLVRFAGTVTSGGAYVRNLYDGQLLGDDQARSGRITVLAKPTDQLSNLLTVQIGRTTGTNAPNTPYYVIPCGQPSSFNSCQYSPANQPFFSQLLAGSVFSGYPAGYVYPGGLESLPAYQNSVGRYVVDQNSLFTHLADDDRVINKTTYDLSDNLSLKNVFGYSWVRNAISYDDDYSPYPFIGQYSPAQQASGGPLPKETSSTNTYSDELQLQGKAFGNRLTYLVGGFFLKSTEDYYSPLWIGAYNANVAYAATTGDKSYAGFAQATYALTDQLNVTLGGRYTKEDISVVQDAQSIFGAGHPQSATQDKPSWTLSVDYHINNELMVYATTRGSWRRGGFNPFNPPTATPQTAESDPGGNYFLPETVRDVEGGFKFDGHVADIPLRGNLAVYNSWVTDIQKTAYIVIAGTASSATVNVPKAEIRGIEADASLKPLPWLLLGTTATYTDARFTQAQTLLFGNTVTYGPFGDVPRFAGSMYGETNWKLPGDKGELTYRADIYGQSSLYFSNLGATIQPGTRLPPYTLLNMRLDWANMFGKSVKIGMFVKNLTNKLYYTGGSAGAQNYSLESATYGLPRTYGLEVRTDF